MCQMPSQLVPRWASSGFATNNIGASIDIGIATRIGANATTRFTHTLGGNITRAQHG